MSRLIYACNELFSPLQILDKKNKIGFSESVSYSCCMSLYVKKRKIMCFKSNSVIHLARAIQAHGHTSYVSVCHTLIMQTDKINV